MVNSEKNILIVDDSITNIKLTAKILMEEGYMISLAQSGEEALKTLQSQMADLIILDVMMPGMDGIELCSILKKNELLKDIPVIFHTAKDQTEDLVEGFKAGGVDYITKPFKRDELLIRVKNHLELADSRNKIIDLNKSRDKLYSILTHDLQSPISSIVMMIDCVKDGLIEPYSDEFNKMINEISSSAKGTLSLLQNLVYWTKLQGGTIALKPQNNSIYAVLKECIDLYHGMAKNKNISIELNVKGDLQAFFDEETMYTVFRNLISNAIKFTHENGLINIYCTLADNQIGISIKDNGVGMSPEIIQKVFLNNEQLTSRGTKNERGNGLGFQMVKDFIKKNHGTLKIESTVGKGSEFIVWLPIDPSI
jgi:two-component system, sensor histidine kinase and response regulator